MMQEEKIRISAALEEKKKVVNELAEQMKKSRTVLIASTHSLPSSQFHKIKKNLRGIVEITIAKKSILERAIKATEKGALQNLKEYIGADIALFTSNLDAFELSALLSDNQSPTKAKAGDIASEDIAIEPGPTELIPGPAISELSGVGLKVAVESGKLAIKQGAVVVKKGQPIKENVASVLGKLNILPLKIGFTPIAAYDTISEKVYANIKIDKKIILEELCTSIIKSLSFAININFITEQTIKYLISKAFIQEKALENIFNKSDKEVL